MRVADLVGDRTINGSSSREDKILLEVKRIDGDSSQISSEGADYLADHSEHHQYEDLAGDGVSYCRIDTENCSSVNFEGVDEQNIVEDSTKGY